MKLITGFVLLMVILSPAISDVIELSNGKTIEGTFIGREGDSIKFDVDGIGMTFNASDVKNISIGDMAPAAAEVKKEPVAEGGNVIKSGTVPVGTTLVVRTSEVLNPAKTKQGHKFTTKLEAAVVVNGATLIPVDSNVYGVVLEAKTARRVAGQSSIKLGVTEIRVNGQMHKVKSTELTGLSEETAKKSAGQVAKWAAIGGLADGSSGAKTGAKVGVAGALLTGGNQAEIPTGTLLEFTLTEALVL
jgi:hypothetical protein